MSSAFAFNVVEMNGTALTGIRSPNFQRRENYSPVGTDGTLHQTSNAIIRTAPMVSFQTIAVRALITALNGSTDLYMKLLNGSTGMRLIGLQTATATTGYLSTASHASRLGPNGQVYLAGLSWTPGNVLVADVDAYFLSTDGTTDPITVGSTTALPTLSVNTEQLVMSSLVIGGLTITNCSNWTLSIAHQCENNDEAICYSTGLPHPVLLRQAGVGGQTEIAMTCDTLDLNGSVTTSGTGVAVFKTVNPVGVGVSSNTTTVTVNGGLIREGEISGQPGGRRITVRGTYNGSNLPLVIANA